MRQKKLIEDTRGQMQRSPAAGAVSTVVGVTVAALVAAFLLPIAIEEIVAVDTSSWGSGATSLWNILDMIIVLGAFLMMIGIALAETQRL